MNELPPSTRSLVLKMLCEGQSTRATARLADVSCNTVAKRLADAGKVCPDRHDELVQGVTANRIQCDQSWSSTDAGQKNVAKAKAAPEGAGGTRTWTALDSESKPIVAWLIGGRDGDYATACTDDLRRRLAHRVQITTAGHRAYLKAVEDAVGADVDGAQLVQLYEEPSGRKGHERKYSPSACKGTKKWRVQGRPSPKRGSTSHGERRNLTVRMRTRRSTRLTNAFSKKFANPMHMVAICACWCNLIRVHKLLRVTPAMDAKLTDPVWEMENLIPVMDERSPKPGPRGPYRKQNAN